MPFKVEKKASLCILAIKIQIPNQMHDQELSSVKQVQALGLIINNNIKMSEQCVGK